MTVQSALVVLIPEAEGLVKPFRDRFDPSAAKGMPAHITILFPFKPPPELTPAIGEVLAGLFSQWPRFNVSLSKLGRFPDALYLAPGPEEPFHQLTQLVMERFPEHPPYEGEFVETIPHLTIAQLPEPDHLDDITVDFQRAAHGRLPIRASVSEVALMDNGTGLWQVRSRFGLSGKSTSLVE
jgi:2'-5' RNA ligase